MMSGNAATNIAPMAPAVAKPHRRNYARKYWMFVVPAGVVVISVILFPWIFTLFMSTHEWKIGGGHNFVGLDNYKKLFTDERFLWSMVRTLYFTALAVVGPMVLGVAAALVFNRNFPLRGLARTIFIR
jgi:multiple sugar transport system permease protein